MSKEELGLIVIGLILSALLILLKMTVWSGLAWFWILMPLIAFCVFWIVNVTDDEDDFIF